MTVASCNTLERERERERESFGKNGMNLNLITLEKQFESLEHVSRNSHVLFSRFLMRALHHGNFLCVVVRRNDGVP